MSGLTSMSVLFCPLAVVMVLVISFCKLQLFTLGFNCLGSLAARLVMSAVGVVVSYKIPILVTWVRFPDGAKFCFVFCFTAGSWNKRQ